MKCIKIILPVFILMCFLESIEAHMWLTSCFCRQNCFECDTSVLGTFLSPLVTAVFHMDRV